MLFVLSEDNGNTSSKYKMKNRISPVEDCELEKRMFITLL